MKNILIVDDEIIIADDLGVILRKLGYNPLEPALNYAEAIERIQDNTIDLAILDINLSSKKSGIDIAEHIRNHYNFPFIYLTSYTDNATLEKAKPTMPYAYLVKPFESGDLKTAIEIAFNNHERFAKAQSDKPSEMETLTPTEIKVLRLISQKMTTRQVADSLFVSESTIKNHRHNISKKLDLPASTNSLLTFALSYKDHL